MHQHPAQQDPQVLPATEATQGVSRRSVVRGGALAVGAAWAAPAILSAVGAPLAAASIVGGAIYESSGDISAERIGFSAVYLRSVDDSFVFPQPQVVTLRIQYTGDDPNFDLTASSLNAAPGITWIVASQSADLVILQSTPSAGHYVHEMNPWTGFNWHFLTPPAPMTIQVTGEVQPLGWTDLVIAGEHQADGALIGPPEETPEP